MTLEDIGILMRDDVRSLVEDNLGRDPLQVALDKNIPYASLVSSQVKYLDKARVKLPSYYAARCMIPPLAFEQSSGEAAAENKGYSGRVCIDLTCGLGVDSFYLSKKFGRVIALERDPVLAAVARINFKLLGAGNIEVVCCDAGQYLCENEDVRADLVYADPDRRSKDGRKLVTLGDCSPDVGVLLPALERISPVTAVKLSPMFDVDEAFRVFGRNARVEVVSQGGECKEVVVEKNRDIMEPVVRSVVLGGYWAEYPYEKADGPVFSGGAAKSGGNGIFTGNIPYGFKWLIVPDVALAKAGNAVRYYKEQGIYLESGNSFAFAAEMPARPFGKVYKIERALPFIPKKLKKEFKVSGTGKLNILKKNFPMKAPEIAKSLSVAEGGVRFAAFTTLSGERWCFLVSPDGKL